MFGFVSREVLLSFLQKDKLIYMFGFVSRIAKPF